MDNASIISTNSIFLGIVLIPDYGDASKKEVRSKYAYLQSAICGVGNASLFLSKLLVAVLIGSIAVLTDAFNHLADIGLSIVIFASFRLAVKEADKEHPHGHGRIEYVLAVIIAAMILFIGISFFAESVFELQNPRIQGGLLFAFIMVAFSAIKEGMAQFSFSIGRKIDSQAIVADGWNHRFDAITSLSIAIAIYITTLGPGYKVLDPIFGLIVAAFIIYSGVRLLQSSGDKLIGVAPSKEVVKRIMEAAESVEGVRNAHEIEVHDYGTHKAISLHVEVEEHMTVDEAHKIASEVEERIGKQIRGKPTVHIEAADSLERMKEIHKIIEKVVSEYEEVFSCHNITVVPRAKGGDVDMHILVDSKMSVEEAHRLSHDIQSSINGKLPSYEVRAHIEPCTKICEVCTEICSKGLKSS